MPTEPLVKEIERAFPDRPFTIELWDGSKVPATNGGGGPTFRARSEDALAYAVASPGQPGSAVLAAIRDRSTTSMV
jgi:cyclopropane-fatty-acyl-phospholipid synthase